MVTMRALVLFIFAAGCNSQSIFSPFSTEEALGEALFHDVNLSKNRTQACATCHDPDRAFVDSRSNSAGHITTFSLGDDGISIGSRNAPTVSYAAFSPEYRVGTRRRFNKQSDHRLYEGELGGLFWDGRASNLEDQAGGPPLNPIEMGMIEASAVVERLLEDPNYVTGFRALYGHDVFDSSERAYGAMRAAIAGFERTDVFSSFDSKYDRSLRGEQTLSFKELTGKSLFFSEFTSCAICHQLHSNGDPINKFLETFTGYEYHNVGTPGRTADSGLARNPSVESPQARGRFKVPTLRNIAVTEPYMHNGIFRDLKTVVLFYDKFVNDSRTMNPESAEPWQPPEFPDTVSETLLKTGRALDDYEVEAMVCFMRTLTDARYEPLISSKGINCDE
ncbi:MAG: cytochrome c peroxidase [Myxococcota bacterium]